VKRGVKACHSIKLNEQKITNVFVDLISNRLLDKDGVITILVGKYQNILDINDTESEIKLLENKIYKLKLEKNKLLELLTDTLISKIEFYERNKYLNNEIIILAKQIRSLSDNNKEQNSLESKLNEIRNALNTKLDVKNNLGLFIKIFIKEVVVDSDNHKLEILLKNGESTMVDYFSNI
jgi:hypothetical protein